MTIEQYLRELGELYVEPPHEQQVLSDALMRTNAQAMGKQHRDVMDKVCYDAVKRSTTPTSGQTQDKS